MTIASTGSSLSAASALERIAGLLFMAGALLGFAAPACALLGMTGMISALDVDEPLAFRAALALPVRPLEERPS